MNTSGVAELIPVTELKAGQLARVSRVVGRADYVHRLAEIGLRGGARIEMFRPGNPCILRMGGNKVCLRASGVVKILVTPIEASH